MKHSWRGRALSGGSHSIVRPSLRAYMSASITAQITSVLPVMPALRWRLDGFT